MTLYDVQQMALELMGEHAELDSWKFKFDNAKGRCGQCRYRQREISISRYYVGLNDADNIRDTLLHEIAHALVGSGHGHNRTWKMMARKVGARPIRCAGSETAMPPRQWTATCDGCHVVHSRHRLRRRVRFGARCNCGRGSELQWSRARVLTA